MNLATFVHVERQILIKSLQNNTCSKCILCLISWSSISCTNFNLWWNTLSVVAVSSTLLFNAAFFLLFVEYSANRVISIFVRRVIKIRFARFQQRLAVFHVLYNSHCSKPGSWFSSLFHPNVPNKLSIQ